MMTMTLITIMMTIVTTLNFDNAMLLKMKMIMTMTIKKIN